MAKLNEQLRHIDPVNIANMVVGNMKSALLYLDYVDEQRDRRDFLFENAYGYLRWADERLDVFADDTCGEYSSEIKGMRRGVEIVRKGINILETAA